MLKGIVDYKNDGIVLGYFNEDFTNTVKTIDCRSGETYSCINQEVAEKFCKENISTGDYYYNYRSCDLGMFKKITNQVNNKNKGYNIEDNANEMAVKISTYNAYPTKISRSVNRFSHLLHDTSFGIELECIKGYLPNHIQYRNGVVICRDGSLHDEDGSIGPEFTTIPLKGAKGVQSLINLGNELSLRTLIDLHCAFHIHLGNLPTSRMFLVSLYKLAISIQDEMFELFPYYKNDERKYAKKDKNYCKRLKKLSIFSLKPRDKEGFDYYINDNYIRIFTFLSNGVVPDRNYNRKTKVHPQPGEKWNRPARYYWINFMNAIFSNRNTVEFRLHEGTTNPQKIFSWLFICNAIVKTAICKAGQIISGKRLTLTDVLNYYASSFKTSEAMIMTDYLKAYCKHRKEYFKNDYENNNFLSEEFLKNDTTFNFEFSGISEMFNK